MRVLATGGAGYLGSTLVPMLLEAGHDVTVLDRFFFGEENLPTGSTKGHLEKIRDDIRWCDGELLEGHDAVVDMAALSNDPAGAIDAWKTYEINFLGRSRIARLAREAKVGRYLVTSSCSQYGFQDGILTEESPPNPLTAYARANVLVEKDNLPLATPEFCPTAVRFSTLYGLSPRMRFDLAVNGMVLGASRTGKIPVMRDGKQWRPFLHVKDAARAIIKVLTAPVEKVRGAVFNVGSDDQNFQVGPLAELVASSMKSRPSVEWYGDPDARSYQVSFAKVKRVLGYEPELRPADAVHEIEAALASGAVSPSEKTKTVEWYRHLLSDEVASQRVALRGVVL
ncbi:MAG: SDR family oxidoreductase [Thermoplasmata archaeon]|nr:SDR family oxidoreductase [Thermoplasmata archaeon]